MNIENKKKQWKMVCYILFVILLIVYLASANKIVSSFLEAPIILEYSALESSATAYANIDTEEVFGDFFSQVSFCGWAFCETDFPNENKTIKLIFHSDKSTYAVDTTLGAREDVINHFDGKRFKGWMHGFTTQFSTVGMKAGSYEIYVYCVENEQDYGLTHLGRVLLISPDEILMSASELNTSHVSLTRVSTSDYEYLQNATRNLEYINVKETGVELGGWAFCETQEDNDQKTISILLKQGQDGYLASAILMNRQDVYDHYKDLKDINGINHGFSCDFNTEIVEDGQYEIWIIVRENEKDIGMVDTGKILNKTENTLEVIG